MPLERPAGNSQSCPARCICDGDAGRHCRLPVVPRFYGRNRLHISWSAPARGRKMWGRLSRTPPGPGENMSRLRHPCLVMASADVDRTRCICGLGKGPFVRGIRVIPKWGKRNGVGESPYAARGVESIRGCQAPVKSARSRPDFAHESTVGALASRGSGAARGCGGGELD